MRQVFSIAGIVLFLFMGCESMSPRPNLALLTQQVTESEQAFAKTMADRDLEAFRGYLAEETIFFSGEAALRGKEEVAAAWARFYEGAEAPFSWEPEIVEVLDSGTLALSSGPVRDAHGKQIGIFNSIWRLESSGEWRVVFDKGGEVCD